jgi:hypothetical protein
MTTTFVTAFCLIKDYKVPEKTLEGYFNHFISLAKTGISLVVYIDSSLKLDLLSLIQSYPNVQLLDTIDLQKTWIYTTCCQNNINLPSNRNVLKDSFDYMVMQNLKLEVCYQAIKANIYNTNYFAWIDFGLFHVIKDVDKTTQQLQHLSKTNYVKSHVMFPGCWPKGYDYLNQVNWRFCGGFFLGHQNAILDMWKRYQQFLPQFINRYNTMLWEVNIWAALEYETDWKPIQYPADHNDTIINVPTIYQL